MNRKTKMLRRIEQLLKRFMDGQTTLDEERELEDFFRQAGDLPEQWQSYRQMFACFENGLQWPEQPRQPLRRRVWLRRVAAAAALVAFVLGACWMWSGEQTSPPVTSVTTTPADSLHPAAPRPSTACNDKEKPKTVSENPQRNGLPNPAKRSVKKKGGVGKKTEEPAVTQNLAASDPQSPVKPTSPMPVVNIPMPEEARLALEEIEKAQKEMRRVGLEVRLNRAEMLDAMMKAKGYSCVMTEDGGVVYEKEDKKPINIEL